MSVLKYKDPNTGKFVPILGSEEDSGWKVATLNSGVTPNPSSLGGFSGIRYRKIGNIVYVNGSVTFTASTTAQTILATLPSGFRPKQINYILSPCGGYRITRLYVNNAGELRAEWTINVSDGSRASGSTWMQVNIYFFVD